MDHEKSKMFASRVLAVLDASATARQWDAVVEIIESAEREGLREAVKIPDAYLSIKNEITDSANNAACHAIKKQILTLLD